MTEAAVSAIRLLLIDDHALFRESMARVLGDDPAFEIEHCGSIREALAALAREASTWYCSIMIWETSGRPSSCLWRGRPGSKGECWWLPHGSAIRKRGDCYGRAFLEFFLKKAPLNELKESIRAVAAGRSWMDSSFGAAAAEHQRGGGRSEASRTGNGGCYALYWKAFRIKRSPGACRYPKAM